MLDVLNTLNSLSLAKLEVGQHFYWHLGGLKIHGQVFLTSWFVIGVLVIASLAATRNIQRVPSGMQNFMEYALDFIRDLAKNQIGEKEYRPWVPFVGTLFLPVNVFLGLFTDSLRFSTGRCNLLCRYFLRFCFRRRNN